MSKLIKYFITGILISLCLALVYCAQFVLKTEIIYSHFFYLPIVLSGFWWGLRGIWVAIFLAGILVFSHYFSGTNTHSLAPNIFILRAGVMIIVSIVVGVLRDQSLKAEKRLSDFSRKILSLREEEKKRTAIDLHDDLGAMVVSVTSKIDIAIEDLSSANNVSALKHLDQAKEAIRKSVADLKQIAYDLRPPDLDILDLSDNLKQYCEKVASLVGIEVKLSVDLDEKRLQEEVKVAVYRIVQEALTNIIKHSHATVARITVATTEGCIKLDIIDNGCGLAKGTGSIINYGGVTKIGIEGMRHRAESLGGAFSIQSEINKGCRIHVVLPTVYS